MQQVERSKTITYRWWRDDESEIKPEHIPALEERADERIAEMMGQGYTSGELTDNIHMTDDDPEDGVEYTGQWEVSTPNNTTAADSFLVLCMDGDAIMYGKIIDGRLNVELEAQRVSEITGGNMGIASVPLSDVEPAMKFYNKRAELIDAFKAVLRDHSATINGLCQVCGHYGDDCTAHKALAILREMGEA